MVAHTFSPSPRNADLCEFEDSLVYTANSRTVRQYIVYPVSKSTSEVLPVTFPYLGNTAGVDPGATFTVGWVLLPNPGQSLKAGKDAPNPKALLWHRQTD